MTNSQVDPQAAVDAFEVSCIFPNHVKTGFIPDSNEYFTLCETCRTPLLPSVLIDALVSGKDGGKELLESEAVTVLISAIGIYWAQYNLEVKPFIVTGIATGEIFPSPIFTDPDVEVRQSELAETLEALDGFGHDEYGSLEEHGWWFLFARDMLTWQVMTDEATGKEELRLGIQQKFAMLSAKNFDGFNQLVDRALVLMESSGELIAYFRDGLLKSDLLDRTYVPYEISVATDTSFWGFCDSDDLSKFLNNQGESQIDVTLREAVPTWSLEWKPIACLPVSANLEVEHLQDYDWDVYGKPDTDFAITGQLAAVEHQLTFKFCAIVAARSSQLDDLVVLDESFDNFEVYLTHRLGRMHFTSDPWITGPGQDFRANFLDDDSGFEESDAMDVVTYYDSPAFVVDCEPASNAVGWFKRSPWAL